jgi:hypothetical protein
MMSTCICLMVVMGGPAACSIAAFQEPATGAADRKSDDVPNRLATVRGAFTSNDRRFGDFSPSSLTASLVELVETQQPELPGDWKTMTVEQRQAWITDLEASDAGKAMIAANERLLAERKIIELEIEPDGNFLAYDVPPGNYSLQANAELEREGRHYAVQAIGQIAVGDVDEVQLGKMPLEFIGLLAISEMAPEISGQTLSGGKASLSSLRGKYVLLIFAELTNPAFRITASAIKEAQNSPGLAEKLSVLTVAIDADRELAQKSIFDQEISWPCIAVGGWDALVLNEYGVRSVPSLWLIGPDGKIVLTGSQFWYELGRNASSLAKLVEDAISGRLTIDQAADSGSSNTDSRENSGDKDDGLPRPRD